jgi:glycosyltransferase involved in cell wall biosynthesis
MICPPLVSIVTPSFNQGRFLRRTVESVLGQGYPHIEYVVIDGGSTDESVAILRSYGDRLAWVSEPDRGQAHALNKGFTRARGQIRAYLNSDDVLAPGAVEKVVAYFLAHPDWDLVYGRAHYIDERGHVTGTYPTAPYTYRRLVEDNCLCQPAVFWRAAVAQKVGQFDERLHCCMDYDYWLRIAGVGGRLEYVEDLLAASRLHPAAKTVACRVPMYRESIAVCTRRTGSVPKGHVLGLWQQRCGGRLPGLASSLAFLHHAWCHRPRLRPPFVPPFLPH